MNKFYSVLTALLFLAGAAIGQSYTSDHIKIFGLNQLSVLTCTADYGEGEIKITPRNQRVKGTNTWERRAQLNGQKFTLRKEGGALNIVDEAGQTVLVTRKDRRLAFVDGQKFQRKTSIGFINFSVSWLDESGEVVVKGMFVDRKIKIKLYQPENVAGQYLLLAAMDDLVRMTKEQVMGGPFSRSLNTHKEYRVHRAQSGMPMSRN